MTRFGLCEMHRGPTKSPSSRPLTERQLTGLHLTAAEAQRFASSHHRPQGDRVRLPLSPDAGHRDPEVRQPAIWVSIQSKTISGGGVSENAGAVAVAMISAAATARRFIGTP
jgi:hypothetical protein